MWLASSPALRPFCCLCCQTEPNTTRIVKSKTNTHAIIEGSHRTVLPGARAVGRVNPHALIQVSVKLRRKKPLPPLDRRPAKIMTRESLVAAYGASKQAIDKVAKALGKFGLKLEHASEATRTLTFSGPATKMEEAFLVKLFNYVHPAGGYRGRVGSVHVPVAVRELVEGVFGLDNRRISRRPRPPVRHDQAAKALSGVPSTWYKSGQLAAHYNYPPGDGSGQTVGILEFGGGYFPDDLAAYCQLANVPVPTVKAISVDGTSTSLKDGSEGEVMLDVEVVAGVCPQATIAVYFAANNDQGWINALPAALHDAANSPGVISVSWGGPEADWTSQSIQQINDALAEAAHLGVTVCYAAGDDGSSDADMDGQAHVGFPCSSPYALAVGGTTIPSPAGQQPDIVWFEGDGLRNDNGGSTGGGVSAVFPLPAWQSGISIPSVNPGGLAGRVIPDVAANADWNASPYLLVVDGGAQPNGGTSAATPLVAALIALINAQLPAGKRVGYLTPLLYQKSSPGSATVGPTACTDVVTGQNATAQAGGYSAGPGFDAASGWGTPNGAKWLAALSAIV